MGQQFQLSNGLPSCIRAGEVLAGKYRLERELGRGAMGTVWAAMHLTLGQRVAIKLISSEHAQSPEARVRFRTEAKAAARLRSRHVVQVYDDGETPEGTPFIVMEHLEGESLEARLEREGAVPLLDAVRITAQVARALARAHAQGIVHRDLKPGNIFLARSDEEELGWLAKVLDFGIAKLDEPRDQSTTKTGTVLGTPLFMSPEQVRGASTVDHRADLYSLGMCFFNMLTGKFAFDGESFGSILVAICTEPLPDLRTFAPWAGDGAALWFQRACARDPSARYQSADEQIEALQAAVGTTSQIVGRQAAPEEQRGPSGTLKGHSPPLSPSTRAFTVEETGQFAAQPPQPLAMTAPKARTQPGVTSESISVLTVPGVEARSSNKKTALFGVAAVCLVAACVAAFFVGRKPAAPELGPRPAATTSLPDREPKPSALVPARDAEQRGITESVVAPAPVPTVVSAPSATSAPSEASAPAAPVAANRNGKQTVAPAPRTKPARGPLRPAPAKTASADPVKPAPTIDVGF
jgi:serine/threonine-protein kinase